MITIFVLAVLAGYIWYMKNNARDSVLPPPDSFLTNTSAPEKNKTEMTRISIVAENLEVPWGIVFLPSGKMLVTERTGRVRYLDQNGTLDTTPVVVINSVKQIGEGGLLGITLHPDFANNHYVYLYYTYSSNGDNTLNRVVKMSYADKKLIDEVIIVDQIPGASNHNGGRIKFGPDGYLYIATGDAQNPSQAQNKTTLGGKILRVTDDGQAVPDNKLGNKVYSYGHRNVQGLAWDTDGKLWATEHGRSGVLSGLDELNLIENGKNYGWPTIQGDQKREGMETPKAHSGSATWAPAGMAFVDGSLYFGGLRGQAFYKAAIKSDGSVSITEYIKNEFGRIRDVVKGPDDMLYITTSNRDGRGEVKAGDDKIIRVNPAKL